MVVLVGGFGIGLPARFGFASGIGRFRLAFWFGGWVC